MRIAVQNSRAAVGYINNVITGRAENSYQPYDHNGNPIVRPAPNPDLPGVKDVDPASVNYCEGDRDKTLSTLATTSAFIYGLIKTIDEKILSEEAGRLIEQAISWVGQKAHDAPVISSLQQATEYSQLAKKVASISKIASGVGVVIDLAFQLKENDSESVAVAKAAGHLLIGLGAGALASAVIAAAPAAAVVATAGGVVLSIAGSEATD